MSFNLSTSPSSAFLYWQFKRLRGQGNIREYLRELEQTQFLDRNTLATMQFEKLQHCLQNAFEHVPFYREFVRKHGLSLKNFQSPEDIQRLPRLDRSTLLEHYQALSSKKILKGVYENFSSGSTGRQARFKQDAHYDLWCRAHQLRCYQWCGDWQLGEPFVLIWGSAVYWKTFTLEKTIGNFLTNRHELNCYDLGERNVERMLDQLMKIQPVLISGYSTALYLLAAKAIEKGCQFTRLRAVQPTAEALLPHMRQVIEQGFKAPAFNKYGSRETNMVAHQCPDAEGMYLQAENVFAEILNDDNQPCRPYEEGRLVLTTLNNHTMPLIRYETGDIATPLPPQANSRFGFQRISEVSGRQHDLILSPNQGRIHPQLFSNIFMGVPAVRWFQVIQKQLNQLEISIYAPHGASPDILDGIKAKIAQLAQFPFEIRFHELDQMPHSPTGKFRLCICQLPQGAGVTT